LFRRTWQSPSNAHAYRLYVVNDPARTSSVALSFLAVFAAISEALDYDRFFEALSSYFAVSFAIRAFAASRCRHQRSPRFYTDFLSSVEAWGSFFSADFVAAFAAPSSAEPATIAHGKTLS
jgi:hypothetical protein